jgi:hypothetical protein
MTRAGQDLTADQRRHFRDEFREARASAHRDAEGFEKIVHVLERLAVVLRPVATRRDGVGIGAAMDEIFSLAVNSPLASQVPCARPSFHTGFRTLLQQVKDGRNDAFHEGAVARHLTGDAIILATVLEDALTSNAKLIGDYMIRQPVCAQLWQPLSFIRQTMLVNSFSHLPVDINNGQPHQWRLVTDACVARFTRADSANDRFERLRLSLAEAVKKELQLKEAWVCTPQTSIQRALEECNGGPVLVTDETGVLIGFATPFDLL